MDNYVVIQQPNDRIVLGVNEDRITILELHESDVPERHPGVVMCVVVVFVTLFLGALFT